MTGMPGGGDAVDLVGRGARGVLEAVDAGVEQGVQRLGRERVRRDPRAGGVRAGDRGRAARRRATGASGPPSAPRSRSIQSATSLTQPSPRAASSQHRGRQVGRRAELAAVVPQVALGQRQVPPGADQPRQVVARSCTQPVSAGEPGVPDQQHARVAVGERLQLGGRRRRPGRRRRARCGSARRPARAAPSRRGRRSAPTAGARTSAGRRRPRPRRPRARRRGRPCRAGAGPSAPVAAQRPPRKRSRSGRAASGLRGRRRRAPWARPTPNAEPAGRRRAARDRRAPARRACAGLPDLALTRRTGAAVRPLRLLAAHARQVAHAARHARACRRPWPSASSSSARRRSAPAAG